MASQDWLHKDFYKTLGVGKDISPQELKKVYRRLARQYHPDSNPGDKNSEEKFKEISEAYDVLSDPKARQEYDQIRAMAAGGARFATGSGSGGSAGSFEDLLGGLFGGQRYASSQQQRQRAGFGPSDGSYGFFGDFFGQGGSAGYAAPTRGSDAQIDVSIGFFAAIRGVNIDVRAPMGGNVKLKIPAGIKDGQRVRVAGKGYQSRDGGEPGDLFVKVSVKKHLVFSRDGDNIRMTLPITFPEAIFGVTVEVPTIYGKNIKLKIPEYCPSGKVLRAKGYGIGNLLSKGDMLVRVEVAVPHTLNKKQTKALQDFVAASPPGGPRDGLLQAGIDE